jgi:hypothetical protein
MGSAANPVIVNDDLPAGFVPTSFLFTAGAGTCNTASPTLIGGHFRVTCQVTSAVSLGNPATVRIASTVRSVNNPHPQVGSAASGDTTDTMSVVTPNITGTSTPFTTTANNSPTAIVTNYAANLNVNVSGPLQVTAGGACCEIQYNVTVTNTGEAASAGFWVNGGMNRSLGAPGNVQTPAIPLVATGVANLVSVTSSRVGDQCDFVNNGGYWQYDCHSGAPNVFTTPMPGLAAGASVTITLLVDAVAAEPADGYHVSADGSAMNLGHVIPGVGNTGCGLGASLSGGKNPACSGEKAAGFTALPPTSISSDDRGVALTQVN